jgi:glucose/arabinose dehydrogenase
MRREACSRLFFGLALGCLAVTAACSEDDDTNVSSVRASSGGSSSSGTAGATGGSSGGSGGVPGAADAGPIDVAPGPAPDPGMLAVNRPMQRDFSPALLQQLRLPTGFRVTAFANGVKGARMLALGPTGDAYVTSPMTSEVWRLHDDNQDGDVDDPGERTSVASAAQNPALQGIHGIAFHAGRVYLASVKSVLAADVSGDGSFGTLTTLVSDLPDGGQHPNRTLAVGPDGLLYVSVGSDCNNCPESNSEHATMLRLQLSGDPADNPANPQHPMLAHNPMSMIKPRVWASGLRNTLGFDWHPTTHELWGIDQGSDGVGADVPPEEINHLVGGKSYGWPYCYNGEKPDPTSDDPSQMLKKEQYCPTTEPAVAAIQAHSSPIAFLFYTASQFPAAYRNDAFLALRGSWDRQFPVGYKVVHIHFANGTPAPVAGTNDSVEDFLSGFLIEDGKAHFGRIAGLTVDRTGALLVSDDTNGMIYRVSYGSDSGGADAGDMTALPDSGAQPDAGAADDAL